MGSGTTVNEAIRAARREAGLSLRELAHRIAVSPATLSAMENGKTGVTVDRLHALATAMGTDASRLLGAGGGSAPSARTAPARLTSVAAESSETGWRCFPALPIDPVLSAAIAAFVETGYHGATMRSLAARAGMSVPGVYHHYRDKQDLLVRILDMTMDEVRWRVRAARDEGHTSIERVALMVEALALYHTHRRELAFIGASEMRSLEAANRVRITQSRNEVQYMLADEIASAVAGGQLRTAHPRVAARAITTMCTSLPQWFRAEGSSSPEEIAAEYAEFALDLLRRQE